MLALFCIFFLFAPLAIMDTAKIESQLRCALLIATTILLIFIAGFRSGLPDYDTYVEMFNNIQIGNVKASVDVGYTIFNMLIGSIFDSSIALFLLIAFLSVVINVRCYGEYVRYVFLAILFYYAHSYFLKELIQIRAGLACAICLYNVRNISKDKKITFVLFQLLASSIHLASLVFLVVPIVSALNIKIHTWYIIIFVSLVIGIMSPLGHIIKALPTIEYLSRIQVYTKWDEFATSLGILRNITTVKQFIISFLALHFSSLLDKKIKYFHALLTAYLVSTCWLILWNDFAILAARVATFLSVGEPIFIAALLYLMPKYLRPVASIVLTGIALLILYLNFGRTSGQYKVILRI
jgi:hypothetical protein